MRKIIGQSIYFSRRLPSFMEEPRTSLDVLRLAHQGLGVAATLSGERHLLAEQLILPGMFLLSPLKYGEGPTIAQLFPSELTWPLPASVSGVYLRFVERVTSDSELERLLYARTGPGETEFTAANVAYANRRLVAIAAYWGMRRAPEFLPELLGLYRSHQEALFQKELDWSRRNREKSYSNSSSPPVR